MTIKRVGVRWRATCDKCRTSISLPPQPKLRLYLTLKREGWELSEKRTICNICTNKTETPTHEPLRNSLNILEEDWNDPE